VLFLVVVVALLLLGTPATSLGCPDIYGAPVIEAGRVIQDSQTGEEFVCADEGYWRPIGRTDSPGSAANQTHQDRLVPRVVASVIAVAVVVVVLGSVVLGLSNRSPKLRGHLLFEEEVNR
jgi:hypothetical protein